MVLTRELRKLLDHDGSSRHVDAERKRLRCEHCLQVAIGEQLLDDFLEQWDNPCVMGSNARAKAGEPCRIAQRSAIVITQMTRPLLDVRRYEVSGIGVGQGNALAAKLAYRIFTTDSRKDERNGRKQPPPVELGNDLVASRGSPRTLLRRSVASTLPAAATVLWHRVKLATLRVRPVLGQRVDEVSTPVALLRNEVRVRQPNRSRLLGDSNTVTMHLRYPRGKFVGVGDRGR